MTCTEILLLLLYRLPLFRTAKTYHTIQTAYWIWNFRVKELAAELDDYDYPRKTNMH